MGYPVKYLSSMVTGASVSAGVDLGASFLYVALEVPTMTVFSASTPLWIQASSDGTTYRRMSNLETNTSVAGVNDFQIASSTSQRFVPLPNLGFRYVRVEASSTVSGAGGNANFNFICSQNQ